MAYLKGWRLGEKNRCGVVGKDLGWYVCLLVQNLSIISWGSSIFLRLCQDLELSHRPPPVDLRTILVKQLFLSYSAPHWTHEQKEKWSGGDSFD